MNLMPDIGVHFSKIYNFYVNIWSVWCIFNKNLGVQRKVINVFVLCYVCT